MTHGQALLRVNLGAALLGGTPLFVKLLTLPADAIVGLRSVIAAVALLAVLLITRTTLRVGNRQDALWLLMAACFMAAHWITYFYAIKLATVAIAVVCIYTFPVMTVFLEALVHRQRPAVPQVLAGLVMLGGVMLVVPWGAVPQPSIPGSPAQSAAPALATGAALALLSALLYAIRNITVRAKLRQYSAISMMYWHVVVVALLVLPWAGTGTEEIADLWRGDTWWLLLVLGVGFTALPHTLLVSSMARLTAAQSGLIACLQPVWAVLFAWLVLAEAPPARGLLGGVLIVSAAAWVAVSAGRRTPPAESIANSTFR